MRTDYCEVCNKSGEGDAILTGRISHYHYEVCSEDCRREVADDVRVGMCEDAREQYRTQYDD